MYRYVLMDRKTSEDINVSCLEYDCSEQSKSKILLSFSEYLLSWTEDVSWNIAVW